MNHVFAAKMARRRLFRYGAERCPNSDYDSRGAHVFYRYLESAGAISERNDLMDVDMFQFRKLAANLSQDIQRLEQQIVAKSYAEAKESLTAYVKDMAAYDPEAKAFPRGQLYAQPSIQ